MMDFFKPAHFKKYIEGSQQVLGSDGVTRELSNAEVAATIANANLEIFIRKGGKFLTRTVKKKTPIHLIKS